MSKEEAMSDNTMKESIDNPTDFSITSEKSDFGKKEFCTDNCQTLLPYHCYLCNKSCLSPASYKRHQKSHGHLKLIDNIQPAKETPILNGMKRQNSLSSRHDCHFDQFGEHIGHNSNRNAVMSLKNSCSDVNSSTSDRSNSDREKIQVNTELPFKCTEHSAVEQSTNIPLMKSSLESDITKQLLSTGRNLFGIASFENIVPAKDPFSSEYHCRQKVHGLHVVHKTPVPSTSVTENEDSTKADQATNLSSDGTLAYMPECKKETANVRCKQQASFCVQLKDIKCTFCGIFSFESMEHVKDHFSSLSHRSCKEQNYSCQQSLHCASYPKPELSSGLNNVGKVDLASCLAGVNCTLCGISSFDNLSAVKHHFSSQEHRFRKGQPSLSIPSSSNEKNFVSSPFISYSSPNTYIAQEFSTRKYRIEIQETKCKLCAISSFNNIREIKAHFSSESHRQKLYNQKMQDKECIVSTSLLPSLCSERTISSTQQSAFCSMNAISNKESVQSTLNVQHDENMPLEVLNQVASISPNSFLYHPVLPKLTSQDVNNTDNIIKHSQQLKEMQQLELIKSKFTVVMPDENFNLE